MLTCIGLVMPVLWLSMGATLGAFSTLAYVAFMAVGPVTGFAPHWATATNDVAEFIRLGTANATLLLTFDSGLPLTIWLSSGLYSLGFCIGIFATVASPVITAAVMHYFPCPWCDVEDECSARTTSACSDVAHSVELV